MGETENIHSTLPQAVPTNPLGTFFTTHTTSPLKHRRHIQRLKIFLGGRGEESYIPYFAADGDGAAAAMTKPLEEHYCCRIQCRLIGEGQ